MQTFCFISVDFLSKTLYLYLTPQYFGDQKCLVATLKGRILIIHCSYLLISLKSIVIIYDNFQTLPSAAG